MYGQPSFPPPMPPKKKGSGCLIAAAIGGGVLLLVVLAVGIFAWRAYHSLSPELRAGMSATWDETMEAGVAPGTDELRALGCGASVVDVATMPNLDESYDAGPRSPEKKIVVCTLNPLLKPVTCEQVATTYKPFAKGPYRVVVQKNTVDPPVCSELRR